jgi:hypothetical protein
MVRGFGQPLWLLQLMRKNKSQRLVRMRDSGAPLPPQASDNRVIDSR